MIIDLIMGLTRQESTKCFRAEKKVLYDKKMLDTQISSHDNSDRQLWKVLGEEYLGIYIFLGVMLKGGGT